jgi:Flp pilus assembly protein TadB
VCRAPSSAGGGCTRIRTRTSGTRGADAARREAELLQLRASADRLRQRRRAIPVCLRGGLVLVVAGIFLVVLLILVIFVIFIILVVSFYETGMGLVWIARTTRYRHNIRRFLTILFFFS